MLHESIFLLLMLSSVASAVEICESVRDALEGYAQHRCDYNKNTYTLDIAGTQSPRASLNQIPREANVTHLGINDLLMYISPGALDNLDDLVSIWFEDNAIGLLPENTFAKLSSLQYLDLIGNQIESAINLRHLPRGLLQASFANNRIPMLTDAQYLPGSLLDLNLSKNNLSSFVMEAAVTAYNLKKLNLNRNRIKEFSTPQLSKLDSLHMRRNGLGQISSAMFQGLSALRYLFLAKNKISVIERGAFAHTPNLIVLELEDNLIGVLGDDVVLRKLLSLFIAGNRLQFLPLKLFIVSSKLSGVTIHGNPFYCGCLEDVLYWTENYGVEILCRRYTFDGIAPACVVHSNNTHYCPHQYREEDVAHFLKNRHTKLLNASGECRTKDQFWVEI